MKKTWIAIFILSLVVFTAGCSSNNSSQSKTSVSSTENSSETTMSETTLETTVDANGNVLNVFTTEELAKYNGKDGQPAYVAYEGNVYDVSNVKEWKTGTHQGKYEAGKDYTDVLNNVAPHPASFLLEKGVLVGILK